MSKEMFEDTHRSVLQAPMSRRRAAGLGAGAISAAMLAGAPIPGGLGRTVIAQDGAAEFHAAWPYQAPPTGHFNSFATNGFFTPHPNIYFDLIALPLGLYYWASDEWLPVLATEWAFLEDGENFEVTLREGVMWSDGTEFTSADVVATTSVLRILSSSLWQYVDEVTAVDDYTVNYHMNTPSTVVERYVIRMNPRPASVYGEFAAQADELFGSGLTIEDPEGAQLLDQLNNFRPEGFVANGPFNVDVNSITSSNMNLEKNETGYLADVVQYDRIVNYNGETDTISAVVLAGDIDYATQAFAPATEMEMQNQGIRILRPPLYTGPALLMNFAEFGDTLGNPLVRRALAHAINREQNVTVARGDSGVAVQ